MQERELILLAEADVKALATLRGLLAEAERVGNENEIKRLTTAIRRKVEVWEPVLEELARKGTSIR